MISSSGPGDLSSISSRSVLFVSGVSVSFVRALRAGSRLPEHVCLACQHRPGAQAKERHPHPPERHLTEGLATCEAPICQRTCELRTVLGPSGISRRCSSWFTWLRLNPVLKSVWLCRVACAQLRRWWTKRSIPSSRLRHRIYSRICTEGLVLVDKQSRRWVCLSMACNHVGILDATRLASFEQGLATRLLVCCSWVQPALSGGFSDRCRTGPATRRCSSCRELSKEGLKERQLRSALRLCRGWACPQRRLASTTWSTTAAPTTATSSIEPLGARRYRTVGTVAI